MAWLQTKLRRRPWPTGREQLKHLRISYSQYAEDLLITGIVGYEKANGAYVDVGCFEPIRYSNTFIFYQRGWSGLAIDANPTMEPLWRKTRPRDHFVNTGIAAAPKQLEYVMYDRFPACNGFKSASSLDPTQVQPDRTQVISCRPLLEILKDHFKADAAQFDLMSVDCEGMDLEVLRSNDFTRFRPKVLLVEDSSHSVDSETRAYCESLGYKLHSMAHISKIFVST